MRTISAVLMRFSREENRTIDLGLYEALTHEFARATDAVSQFTVVWSPNDSFPVPAVNWW
ncbi:MAG: hypothetical protein NVS1B11_33560 [Terriglobales bacterium]